MLSLDIDPGSGRIVFDRIQANSDVVLFELDAKRRVLGRRRGVSRTGAYGSDRKSSTGMSAFPCFVDWKRITPNTLPTGFGPTTDCTAR